MLSVLLSTVCSPAPLKSLTFWRYTNQIIIIIIIITLTLTLTLLMSTIFTTRMWVYDQCDSRHRKMTRSESSVIPFLVPCLKVWLTHTARVPCSNAANIGEHKTWTQSEFCTWRNYVGARAPKNVYIMYVQTLVHFC